MRVYESAGVAKATLRTALDAAAQILHPADVEVTWVTCSTSSGGRCTVPLGRGELIMRLVRSPSQAAVQGDE